MRDAVQSLKAKVIATDLKLDYKDIAAFYSKAKICYEQVHAEDMEAKKQEILRQQEEKKKEILKQQREWEENNRRAVDGQLLIELSDSSEGSADATVVRVYIRPDKSIYYTVNGGGKYEGTPKMTVEKAFSVTLDYQPSKAVYTGATVGGITTGGVHYTQAGYTGSATSSGKGEIRVKAGGTNFELQVATMGEYAIDKFKRDPEFKRVAINGRILCWADSLEAASMLQGFLSATSYQDRANAASAYTDERRLSYDRCKVIAKFLNRVINGQFPVSDEALYGKADELSRAGTSEELKRARDIFNRIADYRDSAERAKEAEKAYEALLQAEKEKAVLVKEKSKKRNKWILLSISVIAAILIVWSAISIPQQNQKKIELMSEELIGKSWSYNIEIPRSELKWIHTTYQVIDRNTLVRTENTAKNESVTEFRWEIREIRGNTIGITLYYEDGTIFEGIEVQYKLVNGEYVFQRKAY